MRFRSFTSDPSVESMWSARNAEDAGTAKRRRERRLRQFLRRERLTVAMLLAETQHHAAPRGQNVARSRGEESATPWARRLLPPGGKHNVLQLGRRRGCACRPAWPQDRVLRRTVEQIVDAVMLPSLDEPQMGNQLVEVLQKIDTRTSHQVIEVPKIFLDSVPQRLVESRPPQMAEQLVEVPTEPVYVLMLLASKVFSRRGLSRLLSGS